MRYKNFLFLCLLFFLQKTALSAPLSFEDSTLQVASVKITDTIYVQEAFLTDSKNHPSPLLQSFRTKQKKNKKIIAVLLAFPFPFGIVGLHRIYLGCAPYVPVAYIASLGGVFGILPFIDFCVLLADKDPEHYSNSKKIFMWIN